MRENRHRKSAMPMGRTFAIVIGIHVFGAAGLVLLSQTETGQKMMETYKVSLMKEEPPPPPDEEEPPPPPPPPEPMEAPEVADIPSPEISTGPEIAGGGGLAFGGKFLGPDDGPMGAFHASVQRRFRKHYQQPQHEFATAEVVFDVAASGTIRSYRIQKSSGDPVNDDAVREAAERLRSEGVSAPPDGAPRVVLVKVIPY
jgi:TonB family protein